MGDQEHRRLQGVRRDRPDLLRPQWDEQDGDQPPGEALRHQRRRHNYPRTGGGAPCRQADDPGQSDAGERGRRRHQLRHHFLWSFEMALEKALEVLETLSCYEVKNTKDEESVKKAVRTAVMSKQYGNEDFLASLITKACISILPEQTTFNVDNVRVCKILGSGLFSSQTVQGMVFRRQAESNIIKKDNCKVAIFTCPVDALQTETKGTVLIKTAEELTNFSRGEETQLENQIKAIAES